MLTGFMLCPHLGEAMLKFECANLVCVVSRTWRGNVEHADLVCVMSISWRGNAEHADLVCIVSRTWRGSAEHADLVCIVSRTWRGSAEHADLVCVVSRSWRGDAEHADLVCVVSRSCTGDVEHADLVCVVSSLEQVMLNMLTWFALCPDHGEAMLNVLTWFALCPDLGEAMLNVLGCLVPFLEHDLLDSLPYTVASTLATFPPTLHKDTIDLLCSSLLPMTLGQHLQLFFLLSYHLCQPQSHCSCWHPYLQTRPRLFPHHGPTPRGPQEMSDLPSSETQHCCQVISVVFNDACSVLFCFNIRRTSATMPHTDGGVS